MNRVDSSNVGEMAVLSEEVGYGQAAAGGPAEVGGQVKSTILSDGNISFFQQKTALIDAAGKPMSAGGTTSGVLRYPHLIRELASIKASINASIGTGIVKSHEIAVLILGPGLIDDQLIEAGGISSPHLHEILAAFPKEAKVTVVDIDKFISRLSESVFGSVQKELADSVLSAFNGYSVKSLSKDQIQEIRGYVAEIPETTTQELELYQQDFLEFKPEPKKYDYIFGMQSLMYALVSVKKNRPEFLGTVAKYLSSLKENGSLITDEKVYQLMKEEIKAMPAPEVLGGKESVRWIYAKTTPFEAKRFLVPNSSRKDEMQREGPDVNPKIFFQDGQKKSRHLSTMDVYSLKRLPKEVLPSRE